MLVDIVYGRVEKFLHRNCQPPVPLGLQTIYEYRMIKLAEAEFSIAHLQRLDKRLLRDVHLAELTHPLLALFLLVEQLALA